jgi:hypothetical protein
MTVAAPASLPDLPGSEIGRWDRKSLAALAQHTLKRPELFEVPHINITSRLELLSYTATRHTVSDLVHSFTCPVKRLPVPFRLWS